MPYKPARPCRKIGCRGTTRHKNGYCQEHQGEIQKMHREYKRNRTDKEDNTFYSSNQWRKVRAYKLQQQPLCEHCEQTGKVTIAKMVDHIEEIKQGGDRYAMDNLQSLCYGCHNRKTKGKD